MYGDERERVRSSFLKEPCATHRVALVFLANLILKKLNVFSIFYWNHYHLVEGTVNQMTI